MPYNWKIDHYQTDLIGQRDIVSDKILTLAEFQAYIGQLAIGANRADLNPSDGIYRFVSQYQTAGGYYADQCDTVTATPFEVNPPCAEHLNCDNPTGDCCPF